MLTLTNVTKKFGGLVAVDRVSFSMNKGEILGLIGPNGSGKTTVFNMITGFLKPTEGSIRFFDQEMTRLPPHTIVEKGISRTFQITSILGELTVAENIHYGLHPNIKVGFIRSLIRGKKYHEQEKLAKERVKEVLDFIGLLDKKDDLANSISSGEQRKLMIGIALARNPKLLLLDEPAAGTSKEEQEELIDIVRKIVDLGISVFIVEHHMHLIMNLCHRIVVLNHGSKIAEGTPQEIQRNEQVIEAYLGRRENAS